MLVAYDEEGFPTDGDFDEIEEDSVESVEAPIEEFPEEED